MRVILLSTLTAVTFSTACLAADPKIVTFFKETCGICHGENGDNKYIQESSAAEIGSTITKGRDGAAKRYKDLPSAMPPNSMSDGRLQALIAYLKADLK